MSKEGKIRLSPSALNLFLECQKCFWLEYSKGIHRPRGIFPSLPGGMDILIKKYFDKHRALGNLPPELEGKVDCELFPDVELLNEWRNWRTGLRYEDSETGAVLSGALDDLGVRGREYVVMDYKTRGFDVKEGGEAFYQNQMNCYGLLLKENGMKLAGHAYLIYFIPKDLAEKGMVRFDIVPKKLNINPDDALKVFRDAVNLLKGGMPASHSVCEYCSWGNDFLAD